MGMRRLWLVLFALAALAPAVEARAQGRGQALDCTADELEWGGPALANRQSHRTLEWVPFGPVEYGWEVYLPLIQRELGADCAPESAVFAHRLAEFQYANGLPATGWFDAATFQVFKGRWQERRPFVMSRVRGDPCPDPPPLYQLAYLQEGEEQANRLTRLLRRDVLDAWRAMRDAARAEVWEARQNPEILQIFSGFRDPEADALRCAETGACDGLRRAVCSAHRTGTAVDLYVGQVSGLGVDNTSQASRLHMSRTPTYRWLVKNAHRFGFTPYVYEPWHWEWISPTGGYVGPPPETAAP